MDTGLGGSVIGLSELAEQAGTGGGVDNPPPRPLVLQHSRSRLQTTERAGEMHLDDLQHYMPALLNGVPAYTIRIEIPLSTTFNAIAYHGALRQQGTAQLLQAVLASPTLPSKPSLATITLRQDVLQVKELLSRIKPPIGEGTYLLTLDPHGFLWFQLER